MKRYESRHNPAVKDISDYIHDNARNFGIDPVMATKIKNVLDGIEITDRIINEKDQVIVQKEQLLVQKERELDRLKSITDNSSKVARNIVNESKGNLDKAMELLNSGNFNEALKYSDRALYNLEDIDNLGLQTIAQANNLYLERKQQYVEAAAKRDNLYNSSVVNGVNAFSWVKDNPTRDFYTFFRETLNILDKEQKSPDNVRIIKKLYELLPLYVEEAQRANYFYNEYNKYYDAMTKLQQVINIYNIKAASSKGLKDYEDALKSCEIALKIEPTSTTLVNLKNAILQAKQVEEASKLEENNLLVSQTQEIETLRELLAQKDEEVHNKSAEKNRIIEELSGNLLAKDKEIASKSLKIGEVSQSVKKENRKLTAKDKLLSDKEQRIEELKALIEQSKIEKEELLAKQELAVSNKSHMKNQIIDGLVKEVNLKEDEVVDLRIQNLEKELIAEQKEKLLIQKETEIQEKSFAKNQVIGDLQDDIGLKEKEALNLKIELLMKQVEFHKKESELKDKASELKEKALLDAMEIVKQKDIVNELQGKLLAFQNLSKHDETLQLELSVIHFKVGESILNGNVDEMKELSKYLSELMKDPIEKDESLDISELLNNLSPIHNVQENQVQNPLAVINNFDINNVHTTHSVLISMSGEESAFSIIQEDGSH
jgi:hypothetical protein